MLSISNNIATCILCLVCLICSGCQKRDLSRVYKEIQTSYLTDQTYISFFDEDLHEFTPTDDSNEHSTDGQTNSIQTPKHEGNKIKGSI